MNRRIRYTDEGIELEAELRRAELIVKQLGLEAAKGLSNPSAEEVKREDDEVELNAQYTTQYKSIVARSNYLVGVGRAPHDIQITYRSRSQLPEDQKL